MHAPTFRILIKCQVELIQNVPPYNLRLWKFWLLVLLLTWRKIPTLFWMLTTCGGFLVTADRYRSRNLLGDWWILVLDTWKMRPNKVHLKDPPSKKPFFSMKLSPRWIRKKNKTQSSSAGMKLVTKGIVEFNRNVSRSLVICFSKTNTLMSLGT